MKLVVYLLLKDPEEARFGHMTIGYKDSEKEHNIDPESDRFFGYYYDVIELQKKVNTNNPEEMTQYLFDHQTKGEIVDDTLRLQKLFLKRKNANVLRIDKHIDEKGKQSIDDVFIKRKEKQTNYSFNPDTFHHPPENYCYNCVTWATDLANTIYDGIIQPVLQGRVKHMKTQMEEMQ